MKKSVMIVFLCLGFCAHAQNKDTTQVTVRDSVSAAVRDTSQKAVQVPLTDTTRLRAASKILQKRYRPKDQAAPTGRFVSDMFLWAHGTFYLPFVQDYGYGCQASVGIGKWFSDKNGMHRYHGIRVGGGFGYFMDNYAGEHMKMYAVKADYIFDLVSYVSGYNPRRIVSVVPVAGLGYTFLTKQDEENKGRGLSAHLGAGLHFHLFPGVEMVLEPLFEIQRDPRQLVRQDIWRGYYPVFRGDFGLNFHLDRKYWRGNFQDPGKDWRISISGGPRLQHAQNVKYFEDVPEILGWELSAGLSRRYNKWFHLRFQAGYAKDYWWLKDRVNPNVRTRMGSMHIMARMDAMVDMLGFFPSKGGRERRVGLLLFVGPEAGMLQKDNIEVFNTFSPFVGAQGGLQFRVNVFDNLSLYLEPRIGIIPYYTTANNRQSKYDNYSDVYNTVSLGLEYVIGRTRLDASGNPMEIIHPLGQKASSGGFFSGMYVWAMGSYFRPLLTYAGSGPIASLGLGWWFTDRGGYHRYHGIRLGAAGGYYYDNESVNHMMLLEGRLDYLFDLTSFLYGYNPRRVFSVTPLVGVTAGVVEKKRSDLAGIGFSAHLGTDLNIQVLPGLELFVEPLIAFRKKNGKDSRKDSYAAAQGSIGLSYNLDRKFWKQVETEEGDWRVSLSVASRMLLVSSDRFAPSAPGPLGWELSGGITRKYGSWFALRVGGGYARDSYWYEDEGVENRVRKHSGHLAGRADAMFNLLGFLPSREGREPRTSLYLFAGPEAGLMYKKGVSDWERLHPFVGAQGGLQLKVGVANGWAVYLEPRVGVIPYHTSAAEDSSRASNYYDMYGTLSVGVEYKLGTY